MARENLELTVILTVILPLFLVANKKICGLFCLQVAAWFEAPLGGCFEEVEVQDEGQLEGQSEGQSEALFGKISFLL